TCAQTYSRERCDAPARSVVSALVRRRTCRHFADQPISFDSVAQILAESCERLRSAASARRMLIDKEDPLANAISFGAVHSFVLFAFNVTDLEQAGYLYSIEENNLRKLNRSASRDEVYEIVWKQSPIKTCAYTLFLCLDYQQHVNRYRHDRAIR